MLLDIVGKIESSGLFMLHIPRLTLDRRYNYKVGVRHLNFRFMNTRETPSHNELFCLSSSLIDLSNRNPLQSLLTFGHDGSFPISNIIPDIVSYYPIQLYELEDATFEIRNYFQETEARVSHIFIKLEILRIDAYGRL